MVPANRPWRGHPAPANLHLKEPARWIPGVEDPPSLSCNPQRISETQAASSLNEASMLAHVAALHQGGRGKVALARKLPCGGWQQEAVACATLVERIPSLIGQRDVYVGMNRFWGPRRMDRLATCSALYCDLDYYNSEHADLTPEQVRYLALVKLDDANKPPPTLTVYSGRGLTLVWLHSEIPPAALSRWNKCQESIFETLSELGADPCARDATRVFRLAGTVNSKSGREVRLLDFNDSTWDFDTLADELLPRSRQELTEERMRRQVPRAARRKKPVVRHTARSLWQKRLKELKQLADQRWPQGIPSGHRDTWLFIVSVALSWLVPAHLLEQHVMELARQYCPAWSGRMTRSCMGSILRRARRSGNGERLKWKGRDIDPRYRLTTTEIIRLLAITPDEMRGLDFRSLVDADRRRTLASTSRRRERRAGGSVDRNIYQARSEARCAQARHLRTSGLSWSEVGGRLGISADAARKRASRHLVTAEPDRSVTVYSGVAMPHGHSADHEQNSEAAGPSNPVGPVARLPETDWAKPLTRSIRLDHAPVAIKWRPADIGRDRSSRPHQFYPRPSPAACIVQPATAWLCARPP